MYKIDYAPLTENQIEYIQRSRDAWLNVAEGGKRAGKNLINLLAWAACIEKHPDKLHLAAGVTIAQAKMNILDSNGFGLRFMFDDVTVVDTSAMSEVFEQVLRVRQGDVFIGLSFPRYSRRTVKAMNYVKNQGATVIAITDSHTSPLTQYADVSLLAKSDMASFVDSLVAPLSLVNALIVAVSRCRGEQLERTLGELEQIWSEYDEYEKSDDK